MLVYFICKETSVHLNAIHCVGEHQSQMFEVLQSVGWTSHRKSEMFLVLM